MEGGVIKSDKTEFTECWRTTWETPCIMRLAFSAVLFLVLLYIRDECSSVDGHTWLQETIVGMAVAGAIYHGAAFVGMMNYK